jgi:hypothetical protein
VMLGMRESHEDWLALGRDLIARGLGAPLLVARVSDFLCVRPRRLGLCVSRAVGLRSGS